MKRRLVLLFLLAAGCAQAQSLDLPQVLRELQATLAWDPLSSQGHFDLANGDRISFRVGSPWALVNYRYLVEWPDITRQDGGLWFSARGLENVQATLRSLAARPGLPRIAAILVDAGHGGTDSGAVGRYREGQETRQLLEKEVVLTVARRLGELLTAQFPDRQVQLTRATDTYLTLEERAGMANQLNLAEHEAVIFISIHANASFNTTARGYEVWVLPSDFRRQLIDSSALDEERKAIAPILNVLLEEEYAIESVTLAKEVLDGFDREVGGQSENRGIREESWFVVRKAKMPSILIELGFVTHPEEARLLAQEAYLQKLAQAIYTGVRRFVHAFEKTKGFTE